VSELFAAVCSIAPTKRRRFLWAAWWSAPPSRQPFRKPDASRGGARTREEALSQAEKAAGRPLVEIDARWARAHARTLLGEPPWPRGEPEDAPHPGLPRSTSGRAAPSGSIWQRLGVATDASVLDIKRAYRQAALSAHPDRGGSAEAFRELQRAYETAMERRDRDARRPKPRR
jgi:hypothetical protein